MINVSARKYVPFLEFRMCIVPKCLYCGCMPITSLATLMVLLYLVYNPVMKASASPVSTIIMPK